MSSNTIQDRSRVSQYQEIVIDHGLLQDLCSTSTINTHIQVTEQSTNAKATATPIPLVPMLVRSFTSSILSDQASVASETLSEDQASIDAQPPAYGDTTDSPRLQWHQHSSREGKSKTPKLFHCLHPQCGKTFSSKAHLSRHERIHSGEKPYKCSWEGCGKRFARKDNMQQHYKIHLPQLADMTTKPRGRKSLIIPPSPASLGSPASGDLGSFTIGESPWASPAGVSPAHARAIRESIYATPPPASPASEYPPGSYTAAPNNEIHVAAQKPTSTTMQNKDTPDRTTTSNQGTRSSHSLQTVLFTPERPVVFERPLAAPAKAISTVAATARKKDHNAQKANALPLLLADQTPNPPQSTIQIALQYGGPTFSSAATPKRDSVIGTADSMVTGIATSTPEQHGPHFCCCGRAPHGHSNATTDHFGQASHHFPTPPVTPLHHHPSVLPQHFIATPNTTSQAEGDPTQLISQVPMTQTPTPISCMIGKDAQAESATHMKPHPLLPLPYPIPYVYPPPYPYMYPHSNLPPHPYALPYPHPYPYPFPHPPYPSDASQMPPASQPR